jgi:hypothetical protein
MKGSGHTYKPYLNNFLISPFEYSNGGIFELLRLMQNLHQSTRDNIILYYDSSFEDEQLLLNPLLPESKIRTWQVVEI